jgi:DNA-binding NarL/FixJ family response regulator
VASAIGKGWRAGIGGCNRGEEDYNITESSHGRQPNSAFLLKILIANPFPAFRHRIITLLRENFSVSRIGEADNGNDAMALLRSDSWDAAILGVRLPIGGGVHFLRRFKAERPELPIVMVYFGPLPLAVRLCLRAGALGYVVSDRVDEELVPSLRAALANEVYESSAVAQARMAEEQPGAT